MYIVILGFLGLVLLISGFLGLMISEIDGEGFLESFICTFIGIVLVGFILFCSCKLEKATWEYDTEPWYSEKIVAMSDNNLVSGRAYSRRCYIDEELYYQYMEELKNGGYQADKVKASITTIYYDNENPRVDWYKRRKKFLWLEKEETVYKMYIPEGSIAEEFSIDLQ